MSRYLLLGIWSVAGCIETGLNKDASELGGDSDSGTTETETLLCVDQVLDGYPTDADLTCEDEVEVGSFTPVVEYHYPSWTTDPSSNNIMMTPAVAPLDDDNGDGVIDEEDMPDIVVVTYGSYGTLRAVSGDGSYELFNVTGQNLQGQGAVAIGDIDGDGLNEIVACTSTSVKAFSNTGVLKWTSPGLTGHIYGTSDAPAIADMDGDGLVEIIVGRAILNGADGSIRGVGSHGIGGASNVGTTSFAADIDLDGRMEVVTGNALYRPDGSTIWYNGESDGYVAAANFDDDPEGEIVVMYAGVVRLQDSDGTVLWRATVEGSSSYYGGPPTVADFDGDGLAEIGVAARSSYTVLDGDGSVLWRNTTQDASSGNTGSAVFDFEGDGVAEVVYSDETTLWVFAGPDGAIKMESTDHSNATWTEYPVIVDVDNDGQVEIVAPNTAYTRSLTGFHVIGDADGSWRPGRKIWNQHAYSITNINDDGSVPTDPEPNWLSYNSFRSGDMEAGDGLAVPDFTLDNGDICTLECADGRLLVWIHPGNIGASDQTTLQTAALVIRAEDSDGGREEVYRAPISDLVVGSFQTAIQIELDVDPAALRDWAALSAVLETDARECDDTNNRLRIEGPFCDE
ncbi:MAG: hypothetical protein ACI8S6_000833 [Myxococcota bacterium]|jgi:hypothetical protein